MTNMFSNASSDLAGSEKEKDVLGGRAPLPTDVYDGKIVVAYITTSTGGARAFNFVIEAGGKTIRETIYVTNKQGQVVYVKEGKKYPLPGYSLVNALTKLTVGKEIPQLTFENKLVKIYNFELKKDVATDVPVAVELSGEAVSIGIELIRENKQQKDQAGNYVDTAEIREINSITRVFHTKTGQTASEYDAQAPAEFKAMWLKEFKGKIRDKTNKNLTPATTAASTTSAPTTNSGGGKPSLFGS
jgi:hypothetical protein